MNISGLYSIAGRWLKKKPSSLRKNYYRFYHFLNLIYLFAITGHLIFMYPLYAMMDDHLLFYSNIVCLIADVICFAMIRQGSVNASFLLFMAAITPHACLGIIIFGAGSSVTMFFPTLLAIVNFTPWTMRRKIPLGVLLTLLAIGLTLYAVFHDPLVELTQIQHIFWNTSYILINCLALGYGVYYFSYIVDTTEGKLRYKAEHDVLTGALNRSSVVKILASAISGIRSNTIAVIMADIDHFKRINDTFGHLAGDEVLKSVTRTLESSLREGDALGRFGGEEFIMVLPGCGLDAAIGVAERIRTMLYSAPVLTSEGDIVVTISLGVAMRDEGSDADPTELIRRADQALYRAKKNGRNRVEHD